MFSDLGKANAEIERLTLALGKATSVIRRAKDPSPVERPSWKRVIGLVTNAGMNLRRVASSWELSLGHLKRRFRALKEIWELMIAEDWHLGEIFPSDGRRGKQPRKPIRYPVLAPWLPFVSVSAAESSDGVRQYPRHYQS